MNFRKLGRLLSSKVFLIVTGVIFFVFVVPWKSITGGKNWFGGGSDANKISYRCYQAMKGIGTKDDDLFGALNGLSGNVLRKVFEAFDTRGYAWSGADALFGVQLNLFEWFSKELSRKEKARMRDIWAKSGLEITF